MVDNVTGFALAGVLGAAAVRQLRRGAADDDASPQTGRGTMESLLGGLGRGLGTAAATGVRTTADVAGGAVRTAGRVGATTLERGIPATTATSGWLLDGLGGLVVGTGRGLLGAASRLPGAPGDTTPGFGGASLVADAASDRGLVPDVEGEAIDVVMVVRQAPGARFHRTGCRMVGEDAHVMPRGEAEAAGMSACGICGP